MNLINMADRKDKNIVLCNAIPSKRKLGRALYRGFLLSTSKEPAITLKNIFKWHPFSSGSADTGWAIQSSWREHRNGQLEVCIKDTAGDVVAMRTVKLTRSSTPVILPEIDSLAEGCGDLTLRIKGERRSLLSIGSVKPNRAFLAVYKVLYREEILKQCLGRGVEIGPGPAPQVIPSQEVDVTYIEQSAPEDWQRLYNDTGNYKVKPQLWDRYQIGEACNLPVKDNSLDFIFSSHVFEHLANPLGHLSHWQKKLKIGGKVLGIVPELSGCKDYVYSPSSMEEILSEYLANIMEPTIEHYARWAKHRRPGKDPKEFYEAKRSIHVHYYTRRNIEEILQYALDFLGYKSFKVTHTPNHKDFYFVLVN